MCIPTAADPIPFRLLCSSRELKNDYDTSTGPYLAIGSLPTLLHPDIRTVILRNLNISATIPESWGNYVNLTDLYLGGNRLFGTLPDLTRTSLIGFELNAPTGSGGLSGDLFAKLPYRAMRILDVMSNSFSGPLPEDVGVRFNRLTTFQISRNQFNGTLPSSIALIRPTSIFEMYNNYFTGCLPPLYGNATRRCRFRPLMSVNNGSFLCCPAPALSPPPTICDLTYCTGNGILPPAKTLFCPLPSPGPTFFCLEGLWATSENVNITGSTAIMPGRTVIAAVRYSANPTPSN